MKIRLRFWCVARWGTVALVLALSGCLGSGAAKAPLHSDTVFTAANKRGSEAFSQGLYPQAVDHYLRALNRARSLDAPGPAASAGYNVAACHAASQQYDLARNYLIEARADFERMGDQRGAGETWLLDARMAHAEKRYPDVDAHCRKALTLFKKSGGHRAMEAYTYLLQARAAAETGDAPAALAFFTQARKTGAAERDPVVLAESLATEGLLATSAQNVTRAAVVYDAAAVAYRDLNRGSDVAHMLSNAASAYRSSEQHAMAAERFYRAARSFYAQGDYGTALTRLELALESAEGVSDDALIERCRALGKSIQNHFQRKKANSGELKPEGEDR